MLISLPKKPTSRRIRITFLAVLVVLILAPIYQAHAVDFSFGLSYIAPTAVGMILDLVRAFLTAMIAWMGSWVDSIIKQPVTGSSIVQSSWELTRNFANMFFIIALIIMAFATIFSISQYDFRRMIVSFLIAALLINFSLAIGEMIIGWSTSLSNVFLQAMGDVGARIGEGAKLGGRFAENTQAQVGTTDLGIWQSTIGVMANIVLLSMIFFSLAVLLFFSIVRIPILWALLIVSPLALVLYILPSTKKWAHQWWDYFISWNLFMPIYLFFIYFGVLFLNNQQTILANASGGISIIPGIPAGSTIQTIFFYVLIGLILIWGAKAAMSFSRAGGAGALAGWAYGKGAVMRRAAWRGTGVPGAYQAMRKQQREEGIRIPFTQKRVFGEQQLREREAKVGALFGVRGMDLGMQREFISKTEKEYKDLQDKFNVRAITDTQIADEAKKGKATNPKIYAYRKMLASIGQLDETKEKIYSQTLLELANNPLAAKDFAEAAEKAKFSNMKGSQVVEMTTGLDGDNNEVFKELKIPNLTPAKKVQAKFVQADELIRSGLTQQQFNAMVDILGGPTTIDGKNFIKDVGENRPDLVIDYNLDKEQGEKKGQLRTKLLDMYKDIDRTGKTDAQLDIELRARYYGGTMAVSEEKLALMPIELDGNKLAKNIHKVWDRPEFKQALAIYIESFPKDSLRGRFVNRLGDKIHKVKDIKAREAKAEILKNIIADLKSQGVKFTTKEPK